MKSNLPETGREGKPNHEKTMLQQTSKHHNPDDMSHNKLQRRHLTTKHEAANYTKRHVTRPPRNFGNEQWSSDHCSANPPNEKSVVLPKVKQHAMTFLHEKEKTDDEKIRYPKNNPPLPMPQDPTWKMKPNIPWKNHVEHSVEKLCRWVEKMKNTSLQTSKNRPIKRLKKQTHPYNTPHENKTRRNKCRTTKKPTAQKLRSTLDIVT